MSARQKTSAKDGLAYPRLSLPRADIRDFNMEDRDDFWIKQGLRSENDVKRVLGCTHWLVGPLRIQDVGW